MDRNQRDRGGQFDQSQRDKLQGGGKENLEQDPTRRGAEKQKQGGKQGGGQQGGKQGIERDIPRRGSEDPEFERQGGAIPGRGSEEGVGRTGSSRQQGVGEPGQTGSPGRTGTPGQTGLPGQTGSPGRRST